MENFRVNLATPQEIKEAQKQMIMEPGSKVEELVPKVQHRNICMNSRSIQNYTLVELNGKNQMLVSILNFILECGWGAMFSSIIIMLSSSRKQLSSRQQFYIFKFPHTFQSKL